MRTGWSKVKVKSLVAEAGEPTATAESDVVGYKLESKKLFHCIPDGATSPAFKSEPTPTVANTEEAGQGGLDPWIGADLVPLPLGRVQTAEQTGWA